MNVLFVVLLILAAVCFALEAARVSNRRANFLALGLLFWVLVPLISALSRF